MAKGKSKATADLADVPFYDYLWQFYAANRRKVRSVYTPLTRKFLDFNDPATRADKDWSLRRPQFEALEMYVFLKEYCDNARLVEIFKDWQNRTGPFEKRGTFRLKIDELGLFETIDAQKFEAAFARMKASAATYPNYIYALTMGLGKTVLMATCIFYEFLLAKKYPKEARYCHNALVFAPDKTVLQSLKEIQTFDKTRVVPPGYVDWLDANLKFHYLDDSSLALSLLPGSEYNIVISNNQKIILKKSHAEKSAGDLLFAAEKKYVPVESKAAAIFDGLDDLGGDAETEDELIANQRFEMLKRLGNLGIYVDEAHHAFGKALEKDFTEKGTTSLRKTINELAACLEKAGTHVVACHNYTGTPYVNNVLLPEVVYTYSLKDAIDNRYLKQADVKGYTNTKSKEFLRIAIKGFREKYGERRVEGMLPKMAIFASDIAELDGEVRPAVEEILADLGVSAGRILVNVGDDSLTTNDDLREFKKLDTPESEKQFILLVNKGKEGWNCRSLFAVALHRTPRSRVFVLQATMRCLRSIGPMQETGMVYLSEENKVILAEELQNNFRLNLDDFTGAGDKGKISVCVKIVPPPVTVRLKRIRKNYELIELNLDRKVDFKLGEIDPLKYAVVESETDLKRVGKDAGTKKVIEDAKENREYSPLTLTAEVARYLGKSCIEVRRVLEESKDGIDAVVAAVNKFNEILYDTVIPTLFKAFYTLEEKTETDEVELRLVKPVKVKVGKGGKVDADIVADQFRVKPELLASLGDGFFAKYAAKSFHLDNYCFDSQPEMDFFKTVLKDEDVEHLYFTGMLTSDKTDFAIPYIDPESNALRSYYPDFLAQKKDGSYVIVEVKGENKIDDAVVQAKARSATQLASANAMTYEMIPGMKASYGLHQPVLGLLPDDSATVTRDA
ncbi:MAG: DEAD/DEAH box helicase family protein [Kiritimatiellae bacterium]|nr:DEAD/DEAH box helicase family protein [Kiritimatiellia bacterium]